LKTKKIKNLLRQSHCGKATSASTVAIVGMGIPPLEFKPGENRESLCLTGQEIFETEGIASVSPKKSIIVRAKSPDGSVKTFSATARIDTPEEISYYHHAGTLQYVLRPML
jgi:aconitate hydratase